jgi:hypothetical protein
VLLLVNQSGVACHTGRRNCFFRAWREDGWTIIAEPQIDPKQLYPQAAEEPIAAADTSDAPGLRPARPG